MKLQLLSTLLLAFALNSCGVNQPKIPTKEVLNDSINKSQNKVTPTDISSDSKESEQKETKSKFYNDKTGNVKSRIV